MQVFDHLWQQSNVAVLGVDSVDSFLLAATDNASMIIPQIYDCSSRFSFSAFFDLSHLAHGDKVDSSWWLRPGSLNKILGI